MTPMVYPKKKKKNEKYSCYKNKISIKASTKTSKNNIKNLKNNLSGMKKKTFAKFIENS